jgi:hypothetical protein
MGWSRCIVDARTCVVVPRRAGACRLGVEQWVS